MVTIYGAYRSRALRNFWLLEELGAPFKVVPVLQAYRLADPTAPDAPLHSRHPDFLKINPNGHIPAMADGTLILYESLAINLYLVKKFGGTLAPADLGEEGLLAMWTLWAQNEIEGNSLPIYYHRVSKPAAERDEAQVRAAIATLRAPFGVFEAHLAQFGHPMGGRFTLADIHIAEMMRYAQPAGELFAEFPRISAWLAACQGRDAFRRVLARREAEPA